METAPQRRVRAMNEAVVGCMLGTSVGDALGLPYEGMAPGRALRMFGDLTRHHFLFGRGMVSDDTEHVCFTAQAVLKSHGDPEKFARHLAWSLRWWLLGLPAGVGFATLRSILKLWLGFPPDKSGVMSAGNGPAMRSPVLGVLFGESPEELENYVRCSTRITHRDTKAYLGAMGTALAAFLSSHDSDVSPTDFSQLVEGRLSGQDDQEFLSLIHMAAGSAEKGLSTLEFAVSLGCSKGVSGYIYHTVPCVIQTWLRFQDNFAGGMREILAAGGDTDTTGAILGGIVGARVGKKGIPSEWLDGIMEWPRSTRWIEALAEAVSSMMEGKADAKCPRYCKLGIIPRNALFLLTVLAHGFRRLAPPY